MQGRRLDKSELVGQVRVDTWVGTTHLTSFVMDAESSERLVSGIASMDELEVFISTTLISAALSYQGINHTWALRSMLMCLIDCFEQLEKEAPPDDQRGDHKDGTEGGAEDTSDIPF